MGDLTTKARSKAGRGGPGEGSLRRKFSDRVLGSPDATEAEGGPLQEFLDRFSGRLELAAIGVVARDAMRKAQGILATVRVFHEAIGERKRLTQISGPTSIWIGKTLLNAGRVFDHAFGK